jgi:hypothetical protein
MAEPSELDVVDAAGEVLPPSIPAPPVSLVKREGGRGPHQLRPMSAEQGVVHRADGSSRFAAGDTVRSRTHHAPQRAWLQTCTPFVALHDALHAALGGPGCGCGADVVPIKKNPPPPAFVRLCSQRSMGLARCGSLSPRDVPSAPSMLPAVIAGRWPGDCVEEVLAGCYRVPGSRFQRCSS